MTLSSSSSSLADKALFLWKLLGVSEQNIDQLLGLCQIGTAVDPHKAPETEVAVALVHVRSFARRIGTPSGPGESLPHRMASLILLLRARDALAGLVARGRPAGDTAAASAPSAARDAKLAPVGPAAPVESAQAAAADSSQERRSAARDPNREQSSFLRTRAASEVTIGRLRFILEPAPAATGKPR